MTLKVQVLPRSSRTQLLSLPEGWKLKISAPPVDGEANKEVCAFFAKALGLPKSAVTLKSGEKSKQKTLSIEGIEEPQALELLKKIGGSHEPKRP